MSKQKGHTGQDWHYAGILSLCMCIGVRIISTKNHSKKVHHDRPGLGMYIRTPYVRAVQSYDNNVTEAIKAHAYSALFGDDNGQYFV